MTNDEVYYWDWSRQLQLSYFDAPPFVAWISALGRLFFDGSIGARFFVLIAHFFSMIFLLLSLQLLFKKKSDCKLHHAVFLCLIAEIIPIFNFESFMLLPDAPLLFSISGGLYVLLKSIRYYEKNLPHKSLFMAIFVGIFFGLGFLSKYQIAPIGLGLLLGFGFYCGLNRWRFLLQYYLIVFCVSLLVSSPVFIWNAQNDWSSFRFQSQHGFKDFHLKWHPFVLYFVRLIILLLPWYCYLLFKLIVRSLFNKSNLNKLDFVFLLPFSFLFFLILISALGKQALPHWAMPAFFLLLPWLAKESAQLTQKKQTFWNIMHILSFSFAIIIPVFLCVSSIQKITPDILKRFHIKYADINQIFLWGQLQDRLKDAGIHIPSQKFSATLPSCKKQTYPYLASMRWYWTAQMAFNFKNHPRVFNFDLNHRSYYDWRDNLDDFSGCRFIVIVDKLHFKQQDLEKFMKVQSIQTVHITANPLNDIYYIEGIKF